MKNRHAGECPELLHITVHCVSTFMDVHQASKVICKVSSVKSRKKTGFYFAKYITLSEEVSICWEAAIEWDMGKALYEVWIILNRIAVNDIDLNAISLRT
jgi:hypothetical protein